MIRLRKPDDFHIHLRQGEKLPHYLADAAGSFARVLVMPNTIPPVNSPETLADYKAQITAAAARSGAGDFSPLFTFKLNGRIRPAELDAMKELGAVAGKYYPQGATTNAEDGVADYRELFPVLESMEEKGLVLSIHGEDPAAFVLDREKAFLPVLEDIRQRFPELRIVLEHISSREGLEAVRSMGDKTGGTITVHHLMRNLDHLLGGFLDPHLFCKPVLKRPEDQDALVAAAFGAEDRFFLGTDSAPHGRDYKECSCGCAGTYTAPVAIPALWQFCLERGIVTSDEFRVFEDFCSLRGAHFYGLAPNEGHLLLEERSWTVPAEYHGVVPFLAGSTLSWSIA